MKQEMITYLSTIKEDIFNLSKYLYDNPEKSFCEHKAYSYILNMLKEHNFKVTEKYLNIDTSFYAEYGSGHPKICYLCEYDAIENEGHITGHNLVASISIAASLALAKVVDKVGGTIIVLGCPGEYLSGAKVTMAKQGVFKDIDVALMAHPDIETAENGTSSAILPIKIKFAQNGDGLNFNRNIGYTPLDGCMFVFNAINLLSKGFPKGCTIDGVISQGGFSPNLLLSEADCKFYIRAPKMKDACEVEKKIKELVRTLGNIMSMTTEMSLYELPYDELIPNSTLSRLFSHNLKETGIIDIGSPKNTLAGVSLGTVSQHIPCIHPFISIVQDASIKYSSKDFARATLSPFAQDKVMKAAAALAFTGLDLIEKEELLKEVKVEFYYNLKKNEAVHCDIE